MITIEVIEQVINIEPVEEDEQVVLTVEEVTRVVEVLEVGPQGVPGQPGTESPLYKETPIGVINGTNRIFRTAHPFAAGSTEVFLNGLLQSSPDDYSETAEDEVTFTVEMTPEPGDTLTVVYLGG